MEEQGETKRKPLILGALVGVLALAMAMIVVMSPSRASGFADLHVLRDSVSVSQRPGAKPEPVTEDVPLGEGAGIMTDATGMAEVTYFEGSLMRVGPDSDVVLETLERGTEQAVVNSIDIGRTFHKVVELSGSERYEVKTANAVAAVRGTQFIVVCEADRSCEIGVIEGTVEVISRVTGERTLLRAGQEITVEADGSLSEIRPLDLTDAWLLLNLQLEGIDVDELREQLFGPDGLPQTDDDPAEVLGVQVGADADADASAGGPGGPSAGADAETEVEVGRGDPEGPPVTEPCVTGYPPRPC